IVTHEKCIMQINAKLEEANRDLEYFAHISSHELREPIRRIARLANVFELECKDPNSTDANLILSRLRSECERALQQITDFRVFSRIGDGVMFREETDIGEVVQSVLEEFEMKIVSGNVTIRKDPLPRLNVYK